MARLASVKARTRWPQRAAGGALLATLMTFGPVGRAAAVGEQVGVSPDSNLPDPAQVQVSGAGFTANATVHVYQCADPNGVESCSADPVAVSTTTNSSGAFSTSAVVKKVFSTSDGSVACTTNCRVVVWDDFGRMGEHPISFPK